MTFPTYHIWVRWGATGRAGRDRVGRQAVEVRVRVGWVCVPHGGYCGLGIDLGVKDADFGTAAALCLSTEGYTGSRCRVPRASDPCPVCPTGVRARQERVPFVLVEDDRFFEESIAPLLGIDVILISAPDATTLKADGAASSHPAAPPSPDSPCARSAWEGGPPRRITVLSVSAAVVPLAEAEAATCGSKATACSQLSRLASASKESAESEFAAPQGVVLPFGTMELALEVGCDGAGPCWPTWRCVGLLEMGDVQGYWWA